MMALAELLILGRLEFTETNMNLFKICLFTIIFFNSTLFASLNTIEKNDFIYPKLFNSISYTYNGCRFHP